MEDINLGNVIGGHGLFSKGSWMGLLSLCGGIVLVISMFCNDVNVDRGEDDIKRQSDNGGIIPRRRSYLSCSVNLMRMGCSWG